MQPLRVNAADLRALAARSEALAGKLIASSTPSGAVPSWQPTAAAANAARTGAGIARAVLTARLRATGTTLADAGTHYAEQDANLATTLAEQVM